MPTAKQLSDVQCSEGVISHQVGAYARKLPCFALAAALICFVSPVVAVQIFDPNINQYSCNTYSSSTPLLGFHDLGFGFNGRVEGLFYVARPSASGGALSEEGRQLNSLGWSIVNNCVHPRSYWDWYRPDGYFPSLYFKQSPASSPKNLGRSCALVDGGVNVGSGNVYRVAVDDANDRNRNGFKRFYNAGLGFYPSDGFGFGWRHSYSRSVVDRRAAGARGVTVERPDGKALYFEKVNGVWTSDLDVHAKLVEILDPTTQTVAGWAFTDYADSVEMYSATGVIHTITDVRGNSKTFSYDQNGRLFRVDGATGAYRIFRYGENDEIMAITDQAGREWGYRYDANGNLVFVDNPDGTSQQYQYELPDQPHALTGVTDERGIHSVTFDYYPDGRVKEFGAEGRGGSSMVTYNDSTLTREITTSRGVATSYATQLNIGVASISHISGPACDVCAVY